MTTRSRGAVTGVGDNRYARLPERFAVMVNFAARPPFDEQPENAMYALPPSPEEVPPAATASAIAWMLGMRYRCAKAMIADALKTLS
jgi:hypothetical protein